MVSAKKKKRNSLDPNLRDLRAPISPEPDPAHRSPGRKDTKKWCRGKVGVEHETELKLKNIGYSANKKCHVPPDWWYQAPVGKRAARVGRLPNWWCRHEEVCVKCHKITRYFINPDECPDWPGH